MKKREIMISIATAIAIVFATHAVAQNANVGKIGIGTNKILLSGMTDYSVRAEISVDEPDDYLLYAWIFGIRKSDGSYFDYEVVVDGHLVGTISPQRGNWQMIGLDEEKTIELKSGCHIIEISSKEHVTPLVEAIKLTAEAIDIAEFSADYDSYLDKALKRSAEFAEKEIECSIKQDSKLRSKTKNTIKAGVIHTAELPLKYSFFTIKSLKKGDDVTITSSSTIPHTIDVEIYGNPPTGIIMKSPDALKGEEDNVKKSIGVNPPITIDPIYTAKVHILCSATTPEEGQGLGWYFPAEKFSRNSYKALGKIKITQDGFYLIRLRATEEIYEATADISIGAEEFYDDVPVSVSEHYYNMLPDGKSYTVTASSNYYYGDAMLFVRGADADRLVGYNDDTSESDKKQFGLGPLDACLSQKYLIETTSIDITNYSSIDPDKTCTLRVGETESMKKQISKAPPKGHSSLAEIEPNNPYQPEIFNSEDIIKINSNKIMKMVSVTSVDGVEILHLAPNDYSHSINYF